MPLMIKTTGLEDYLENGEGYVKALILGDPGVGKTRSSGFWPKPILADCENGRMSVADLRLPYVAVNTSDEMFALLDEMERESKKPTSQRKYQTLVVDTVDAFQRIVMQERMRAERKDSFDGWKDWGYLDAKMIAFVQRLQNLRMNIVVNCHVKTSNNDDGPALMGPKLKGDFKDQIAAEFDLVGHMTTAWKAVDGKRTLTRGIRWEADPGFPMLKDRSGRLPAMTEVTFSTEDYTNLFLPMAEALNVLQESETVGQIEMPEGVPPAPPDIKGGPVAVKEQPPAAKTAAKPAGRKKATEEVTTVGQVEVVERGADPAPPAKSDESADKAKATPTAGTTTPVDTPDEHEVALALVQDNLGGEVLSESKEAEPVPTPASPAPAPATNVRTCGTPGLLKDKTLNPDPAPGCGKSLENENKDMVNVAFLKTRTYLCQSCLKALKAAS